MDYKEEAKRLVRGLDQRMAPSAYDTAWLARLRTSCGHEPVWPDAIEWLLENQHPDGSWGGQIAYYHDRIICTLAALIALRENGQNHGSQEAITRAERYLWHHLHHLPRDPFELAGFELIFPTLIDEARSLGLDVPGHTCGYGEIQTAKLRLIPPELLYSPHISTVYSLEFLGGSADVERLRQARAINGSLGTSPATTAYYLLRNPEDEAALAYLRTVRDHSEGVITVYPFRTYEVTWVLNNLALSGAPLTSFADDRIWQELSTGLGPDGIGMDPAFGVPDGDTTSVTCRVLIEAGCAVDPLILASFEIDGSRVFRTWEYERNVSVSTNIHALEALRLMPDYPDCRQAQEQVILMLLDNRKYKMYWTDKWQASPYYTTAHALVALLREGSYMAHACRDSVDWLLHTQRSDGSWGFFEPGTLEETAYALTALLHYHMFEPIDEQIIHRGAAYLAREYETANGPYPELWISKCLFAPSDIIRSAALSALILYEEVFGRSPQ